MKAHNLGLNAIHPKVDPPDAPTEIKEQAKVCVLSRAGHIPEYGIDLWSGAPSSRVIDEEEGAILRALCPLDEFGSPIRESGYTYFSFGSSSMMDFMANYTLAQGLNLNDQMLEKAEEFIHNSTDDTTRDLGHEVLEDVVISAVEDMAEDYSRARELSLLHPNAPATAGETVIKILGNTETREKLFPWLARRLAPEVGRIATPPALQTEVLKVQFAY